MGPKCHHKCPYKRETKGDLIQTKEKEAILQLNAGPPACYNKSQTHETCAGEKESGLFRYQHSEKMGISCPSPHISAGRGVYKEGKKKRMTRSRDGFEKSLCVDQHSPFR